MDFGYLSEASLFDAPMIGLIFDMSWNFDRREIISTIGGIRYCEAELEI